MSTIKCTSGTICLPRYSCGHAHGPMWLARVSMQNAVRPSSVLPSATRLPFAMMGTNTCKCSYLFLLLLRIRFLLWQLSLDVRTLFASGIAMFVPLLAREMEELMDGWCLWWVSSVFQPKFSWSLEVCRGLQGKESAFFLVHLYFGEIQG